MLTQWLCQVASGRVDRTPRHVYRFAVLVMLLTGFVMLAPPAHADGPVETQDEQTVLPWRMRPPSTPVTQSTLRLGQPLANSPLRILMYHYIRDGVPTSDQLGRNLSVAPPDFEAQMRLLVEHGYTSVTLDDWLQARADGQPLPAKAVALTFDDGYADFYEQAWPVLQKYKLRATIYVITGKVEQPGYLTWAQIAELAANGIVVGGHTVTHPRLTVLSEVALTRELRECQRQLQAELGVPVRHFAYPSGAFDARVRAATQAAGYLTATTTQSGVATLINDPLALPRLRISGGMSLARFAALLGERTP